MVREQRVTRRCFLGKMVVAMAAPHIVSSSALGREETIAPSSRIGIGMIGVGRQSIAVNLREFLDFPDTQVLAVCEVDAWRMVNAKKSVEDYYGKKQRSGRYKGCGTYVDFEDLLARRDIDAVMISTPDHWHVPMSLAAVKAGKDVACEKPIARTIAGGRALSDAVRKHKRVFRVDSEFRSRKNFHRMCELVRNGRIGKVRSIEVGVPAGDNVASPPCPAMRAPEELDYKRWLGRAPYAPYTENRVHTRKGYGRPGWMRHLDYCDGMITNWGTHLCDIVQWGNGTERTGPVEVEGGGAYPPPGSFWNVLKTFEVHYAFANGVRVTYKTSKPFVRFEGSEGWIHGEFPQGLKAEPASILNGKILADEISFPFKSEKRDFIDAVKTRGQTLEDAEVGHRTTSLCLLGHIAIQIGEKLRWDPERESFVNNNAANGLVDKPIRTPKYT